MKRSGKDSIEKIVLRRYRWVMTGLALLLMIAAGVMTFIENSESVMEERSVKVSDIYPFSFVTQESEPAGSGNKSVTDSAVQSIVDSDEVYYSDSFFAHSNSSYDHELARASLALSMTAFKKKHVISFMEDLGYESVVSYRYDQNDDEDKVALVMGHKVIDGVTVIKKAPEEAKSVIAVAIRGGKYGDEWGSNGRVGYDGESFGYHYGFHKAAEDAIVQLKEYAADNDLDLGKSAVWITGFSRGGAVANVMGAMLTGQAAVGDSEERADDGTSGNPVIIRPENLFDYTFASPNTVSEALITETGENDANEELAYRTESCRGLYNIVNPLDIVTRLPMNASGISKTSKGNTIRYSWGYTKYGTTLSLSAESGSAQLQVVQLLENALAFATRNEVRYVERTQDQVIIPALKKTMGKGADVRKRNIGYVLVDSLPGVTGFLKSEVNQLDLKAQIYVAGILSGKQSIRLEKEHWPEHYWGWMVKSEGLE